MAITGKVHEVGVEQSGTTQSGKQWRKKEFVLKTDGPYPSDVAFSVLNNRIDEANIKVGDVVEIECDIKSRKYKDRWYTEATAWRINNKGQQSTFNSHQMEHKPVYEQQPPQGYAPSVTPKDVNGDDLPF